jgi:NAD(P)-dependent dehydrogenase (short-subunit alcohol dehydrogenase family)
MLGPDWRLDEDTPSKSRRLRRSKQGRPVQLTLARDDPRAGCANAITPGGVFRDTPDPFLSRYVARVPLRRMAIEQDFKGAVAYLASDLSAYVTGQNLVVDGGWTAW